MYTLEEQAIHFVEKAFAGQKRIKEDIPLSFHSIMVGYMLKDSGYNKEVVLTGFLHDIIEDTEYTYEDIKSQFGKKIADNVLKVSEDVTITDWTKRKEEFFYRMTSWSKEIFLVELFNSFISAMSTILPLYISATLSQVFSSSSNIWLLIKIVLPLFFCSLGFSNLHFLKKFLFHL